MKNKIMFLVSGIVILTLLLGSICSAEDYRIKLSHQVPEGSPQDIYARAFKEAVENKTDKLKVEIFISNQLGDPVSVIESIQLGTIEMGVINVGSSATIIPELSIFNIPALLPTEMSKVESVFKSDATDKISNDLKARGLKAVGAFSEPYMQLTANKPIKSPEDLKGLKIRTMNSKILISTYKELEANPTPLPFAEVYSGLQLGMIDAQENPYDIIYDMHYYEVQDYVIASKHGNPVNFCWISERFFNSLPAELQNIIVEAGKEAQDKIFSQIPVIEEKMRQNLIGEGMEWIEPEPELHQAFVKANSAARKQYLNLVGQEKGERNLKLIDEAVSNTIN